MISLAGATQAQVPVGVVEAKQTAWQSTLGAVGSLRAVQEVQVATELSGRVTRIAFESGDRVNTRDVLVALDSRSERAELADLEAQLELARLDLERFQRLVQRKSASEADRDAARSRHAQIEARISGQRTLIDKKNIRAPFAGKLGIRQVNLGEVLEAGAVLVSLQASNPIFADFPLPQNSLSKVTVGQTIRVSVDAYPKVIFTGKVAALDARVNADSRAITVRAQLANDDDLLVPGMFVGVEVQLEDDRQFITVPSSSIIYSPFGDNVYLVEAGDNNQLIAKRIAVVTGSHRGDQVAVTKGISAGDRVVVAGQINLRDGVPVMVDANVVPFNDSVVTAPGN
jgi:membrane fusion protein (multidrug efflux system)